MANFVTKWLNDKYILWKDLGGIGPGGLNIWAKLAAMLLVDSSGNAVGTVASPLYVAPGTVAPTIVAATGAGAITLATTQVARPFKLNHVTLHLSAAPTTSETLTISLDAADGAAFDAVLYSVNAATERLTDLLFQPDQPLLFKAGDQIAIAFTNSDGRTYGARISAELV